MSGQAVVVEGLSKKFRNLKAVENLCFSVERGSIYGFIGPNGAGKTTTLKILATLLTPNSGTAEVAGYDVLRQPSLVQREIGYMPDFFGVYEDLTVNEYLDFYASAHGIKEPAKKKTCADLLELVDLSHKSNDYVNALSRGMKQRLCLARCLVHDPAVLLLDEPASGLDPRARAEMRELLKELSTMEKTIIISSHILSELEDVCTHVGIIEAGKMVYSGPVEKVGRLSHQKTIRVKLLSRQDEAVSFLETFNGVSGVELAGKFVEFTLEGGAEQMSMLLKALIDAGFPVASFAEEKNALEMLFLNLTEGVIS